MNQMDVFKELDDYGDMLRDDLHRLAAMETPLVIRKIIDEQGDKVEIIRRFTADYIKRCKELVRASPGTGYRHPDSAKIAAYAVLITYADPIAVAPLLREIAELGRSCHAPAVNTALALAEHFSLDLEITVQ